MDRAKVILLALAFLLAVIIASAYHWWNTNSAPVSPENDTAQNFVVPKGRSATQVGSLLYQKGLIKDPLAFKIYVQVFGKQKNINAGQFRLSSNMNLAQIVEVLGQGPVEIWVTIPEGLRREEVVEKIVEGLEMEPDRAEVFRSRFLFLSKDREGYLFPDTYLFPKDVDPSVVVGVMTKTFEKKLNSIDFQSSNSYSVKDLVVLASIVERETRTDQERPVVAGIFFNRLSRGMALQADATVQYALANFKCGQKTDCQAWWPKVLKNDLEIKSPYNTYLTTKIPPSPIASPGLSSLKAVLFPPETDYLYYLHDSLGQIHYARTLNEHNANVQHFLR